MTPYRIAVLVGSLRRESVGVAAGKRHDQTRTSGILIELVRIDDLPLFNQDDEKTPAASLTRFKSEISSAQGLMFVTPEYNRSIPGVLKRDRSRIASIRTECVGRQASGRDGRIARLGGYVDGPATSPQRPRPPGRPDGWAAGSLPPGPRGDVRRRRQPDQP